MNIFLFVIGFLLIFLTVIVMIVLAYIRRGVKKIKQAVTGDYDDEEAFRRMADKHYRQKESPQFDKDYFKSKTGSTTSDGKQQQARPQQQQQQQTKRQARSTQAGNVTIIDERDPREQRKIFNDNEGEYVEFEEV